jgi:hypothetical protein
LGFSLRALVKAATASGVFSPASFNHAKHEMNPWFLLVQQSGCACILFSDVHDLCLTIGSNDCPQLDVTPAHQGVRIGVVRVPVQGS